MRDVLYEEPDDGMVAHESELHAELEIALVEAPSHVEVGAVLARAKAARDAGALSREAFGELLESSGQEEFWNRFLL